MLFSQQVMSCACSVSKLLLAEYQLAWFLADWACHIEMNWLHLFIKKHNFCKSTPKYQRYLGVALTRCFALFRTSAPQCHEGISPVFDLIIGEHIYSYQRDKKIRRERKRQKKGTSDRSVTQRQQQGWANGGVEDGKGEKHQPSMIAATNSHHTRDLRCRYTLFRSLTLRSTPFFVNISVFTWDFRITGAEVLKGHHDVFRRITLCTTVHNPSSSINWFIQTFPAFS